MLFYWIISTADTELLLEWNSLRLARGWRAALIRQTVLARQTKISGDLVLEIQQGITRAHRSRLFSVHSQSIVSCAFAAIASSSAIFPSALITGIKALSIKGTWRKSVKVRCTSGGSLSHHIKTFQLNVKNHWPEISRTRRQNWNFVSQFFFPKCLCGELFSKITFTSFAFFSFS